LRNEYLATENRILKAQLRARLRLSDTERVTLGEIGHRLGPKAHRRGGDCRSARHHLGVVPKARRPQIRWIACTSNRGRPPSGREIEELIVRMAKENRFLGYDRIVGSGTGDLLLALHRDYDSLSLDRRISAFQG
jgi:putative transposase